MLEQVVFINSYQRSGSTLLGILLGIQENVTYIGESRNIEHHLINNSECYCNKNINNCKFWSEVFDKLNIEDLKTDINLERGFYLIKAASLFNPLAQIMVNTPLKKLLSPISVIENIIALYQTVSNITSASNVVDSSHRTEHMKLLLPKFGKNLKIIFLVRDGRAVVNSVLKRQKSTIITEAKRWKRFHILAKIAHWGLKSENIIMVRYEDLCNNPEKEMDRVGKLLGISTQVPFDLDTEDVHFIGGSPTIKKAKLSQIKLDESWKKTWSAHDINDFEKYAGKLNNSFGYI